jgi:hypothetical protein
MSDQRSKSLGQRTDAGGTHDLPPSRDEAAMNLAEQKRIAAELAAARDRQASTSTPAASKTAPAR